MASPRLPWIFAFYFSALMLIQVRMTQCADNTTQCSSRRCNRNLSCSSPEDCIGIKDPCLSNPCSWHAKCQVISSVAQTYVCQCPAGYTGENCDIHLKRCPRNPCGNGGECYVGKEGPICACTVGYKGKFCETPEDECLWNPCQNGAMCKKRGDEYACYCVPGFQGALCDIEVDECISQPCHHGATCLNQIGQYTCMCPPQYTGRDCELEVDECVWQPCLNGATCHSFIGSFNCTCPPGFEGDLCQFNIDECASFPCLNGGHCIDGDNGYTCECNMVGFNGLHCEMPVSMCESKPCHNNATCLEVSAKFTCLCLPGSTGSLCEIDISECSSQPCLYDSECVELAQPLMGTYNEHAGYICKCRDGLTGVHCESDINECESKPCQNGGACENLHGSYTCHCRTQADAAGNYYGGRNCKELLVGCATPRCHNGGTCIPQLKEGEHSHHCLCPEGYAGPSCRAQTTFSFNGKSVLPVNKNSTEAQGGHFFNISLSFQTVQASAVIFHMEAQNSSIRLYLQNSAIYLASEVHSEIKSLLHLPGNVSDGRWHAVGVSGTDRLTLRILDAQCTTRCTESSDHILGDHLRDSVFQKILLGGEPPLRTAEEDIYNNAEEMRPWFVGCLRDVRIDSAFVTDESTTVGDIDVGCKRRNQCESQPCQNRGQCINLWLGYHCDCFRPYRGQNCSSEYESGRFGHRHLTSHAAFQVNIDRREEITISAFFRTRQPSGFLLSLGNSTYSGTIISLDGGRLTLKTRRNVLLKGNNTINDGNFHLVSLKLTQTKMEMFVSLKLVGQIDMTMTEVYSTSVLYVGGLVDPKETAKHGGYFKGCVQDLRIAEKHLEFFSSSESSSVEDITVSNVTRGCESDSQCNPSTCHNGGVCYPVWDDFVCSCPPNTTGKACEDLKWCQLTQCPPGSMCQTVPSGYECTASVVFNGTSHGVMYRSNSQIRRDLTNVTLQFRTQASESILLYAEQGPDIVTVAVQRSRLLFHLQSGNSIDAVSLYGAEMVNDSQWHSVTLSATTPQSQSSRWQMEVDGKTDKISLFPTGNLNFLREGTDIYLGINGKDGNLHFIGCLGTVQIGGIYLPYFGDEDYQATRPQKEQFVKVSPVSVGIDCLSLESCASQHCTHGDKCRGGFTHPICTCPSGRTGPLCETYIHKCHSSPCLHGICTDTITGYSCECHVGYSGVNCDIHNCQDHRCARGATCIAQANGYSCLCPANVTGSLCRYNRLPSTFCGDGKKNITCYNRSNCTEERGKLRCTCLPGFVGERCEIDVDECESNPCLNGGLCQNLPNRFHCICDLNFAGEHCEIDLSDFFPPGIFTAVASVVLALFFIVCAGLCIFIAVSGMRSSQGAYSPSRQEKEGSRVEMWNIVQPPPLERLI
ncbi:protein crumbs homolog 1 isoform X2 [Xenopus laevis]|uniref:Protein crumbs homolog 1 isoform X2 n=1 Tax=Xenopus laevis TaxID=8355 RepID=A0A8J1MZ15_XENLA|nr:protein crumbs homolog 1 isoform X2 [Xenopus laevis]